MADQSPATDAENDERADCTAITPADGQISIDDLVAAPGEFNRAVRTKVRNDIRAELRQAGVKYSDGLGDRVYEAIEWLLGDRECLADAMRERMEALAERCSPSPKPWGWTGPPHQREATPRDPAVPSGSAGPARSRRAA